MRTNFVILGTIVTVILLAAVHVLAGDNVKKPGALPTGTLSGKIIDPDGKPVSNARIRVYSDKLLPEAHSDAQGRFRLGPWSRATGMVSIF